MDTAKYRLAQQNALLDPFKRHSVNLDAFNNYDHANRTHISTNRLSNEKILSYSYYTNQNYDQKHRNKKLLAAAAVVASAATKDSLFGTSLNSLNTVPHKKQEPISKMNSTTNTNLSSQLVDTQDSIFQKIMNKLAEFPDNKLAKNANDKYKSNPAISNADSNNYNKTNFDGPTGLGLIKENGYGYRSREPSKRSEDLKRNKYKSMYIGDMNVNGSSLNNTNPYVSVNGMNNGSLVSNGSSSNKEQFKVNDMHSPKVNINNNNNNLNSLSGDLSNISKKMSSNNNGNNEEFVKKFLNGGDHGYFISSDLKRIKDKEREREREREREKEREREREKHREREKEKEKERDKEREREKEKIKEAFKEVDVRLELKPKHRSSSKSNRKSVDSEQLQRVEENLKQILADSKDHHHHHHDNASSSKDKDHKRSIKYSTVSNGKNLTKVYKKYTSHHFDDIPTSEKLNKKQTDESNASISKPATSSDTPKPNEANIKNKKPTEEIEKEANFAQSEEDSSESEKLLLNSLGDEVKKKKKLSKKSSSKKNNLDLTNLNTAKIINFYPNHVTSITLNQQLVPFSKKNLDEIETQLEKFKIETKLKADENDPRKTPVIVRQITINPKQLSTDSADLISPKKKPKNTLKELDLFDERIKKIEKVIEKNQHRLDKTQQKAKLEEALNELHENQERLIRIPALRKISTPPPLPHILDSKNRNGSVTPNGFDPEQIKMNLKKYGNAKLKPTSITSTIREGKIEKPIRVNHGLPPPPPVLQNRQSNGSRPASTNYLTPPFDNAKLFTPLSSVSNEKNEIHESEDKSKLAQLLEHLKMSSPYPREVQAKKYDDQDNKLVNSNNKYYKEMLIVDSKESEQLFMDPLESLANDFSNNEFRGLKSATPPKLIEKPKSNDGSDASDNSRSKKTQSSNKNHSSNNSSKNHDPYEPPKPPKDSKREKNFYETYAKENDKRKREGNGFLMLLPGIAIPIDTDAGESDDELTYSSD